MITINVGRLFDNLVIVGNDIDALEIEQKVTAALNASVKTVSESAAEAIKGSVADSQV